MYAITALLEAEIKSWAEVDVVRRIHQVGAAQCWAFCLCASGCASVFLSLCLSVPPSLYFRAILI